jgi:hypothetical protein
MAAFRVAAFFKLNEKKVEKLHDNAVCPICNKQGLSLVHERSLAVNGIVEIHANEYYGHYVHGGDNLLIRFGLAEDVEELIGAIRLQ